MNNQNQMNMMNNVGGNFQNQMNMMNNNNFGGNFQNQMNFNNNNFGGNFQNQNQMNFNNNNQMNVSKEKIKPQDNNQKIEKNIKEIIPREDKILYTGEVNSFNPGDNIINVALNASSGLKVIVPISTSCTIAELIQKYAQKVGIPQDALGTKIIFLFGGGKMEINSQKKIKGVMGNGAVITVIDQGGIIGA